MAEGARDSRPLSPHLQIWGWTVTMAASILTRVTGFALYGGLALLALWVFSAASSPKLFGLVSGVLVSPVGIAILFGFGWALIFHALNGLRHLYWDTGRGLDLPTARGTSYLILAGSLALDVLVFWIGLTVHGGA
ncbi:MAG: succinate dehydrogenase, cytochrome b556 subunit [Parvularculaceae bacterium]